MNLADYRAEVKDRLGVPAADTQSISNVSLDRAINAALKHIATQADWPWLFAEDEVTLAADADRFLPPATWVKTHYLRTKDYELSLRSARDLHRYLGVRAGAPAVYAALGDHIVVKPVNDTERTLTHGYTRTESPLILDTDAPLLPDAHSDWLINEAGVRIAMRTNNQERLAQLREESVVAKKAALDNVRRTAGLPPIRRTKPSVWQEV